MSDEEYFSEKYKDYISNSGLGFLNPDQGGSIENYLKGFEESYSESFELGSAIHCMTLQPEDYIISKYDKPSAKLGLFVNNVFELRKKGYKLIDAIDKAKVDSDYYAKSLTNNRLKTAIKKSLEYYLNRIKNDEEVPGKNIIYLSTAMRAKFESCMQSIRNDKKFLKKLKPDTLLIPPDIYNEYALFCNIEVNIDGKIGILKLKGKLDNFTVNFEENVVTLNDLKSTGKPASYFMGNTLEFKTVNGDVVREWKNGSFQTYHYYRQMALYLWMLNAWIKKEYPNETFQMKTNMLLIETIPNFNTKICIVKPKHIKEGLDEFKRLILILSKWMESKTVNDQK